MNIQSVTGGLSDKNALAIQNMVVSECTINTKIDMITLSSLNTYELYAIVFSNLTFKNLEFTQNANIFNLGHLLPVPVQILDSSFSNIKGGKINVNSFTNEIANLSTILLMENVTAKNLNTKYNSFIELQTGAVLFINNSVFTHVSWYEEGSVLLAGTEKTKTQIENTIFEYNTALQGGVIFVEQQSLVQWSNCTFINNFAVEGGVIATYDNGYFMISDSIFTKNMAIAGLVVNIFSSAPDSSLLQSNIASNIFLDSNSIIEEITETWNLLWFLDDGFKEHLQNNTGKLNVVKSPYAVKSILGSITIFQVDVNQQNQFTDVYSSTLNMNHVNITNILFSQPVIKASLSILNGSNMIASDISNPRNNLQSFISCSTESSIFIDGLTYTSSQASFALLRNATGILQNINITFSNSVSHMILVDDSYGLKLETLLIDSISSQAKSAILIKDSVNLELENITILKISQLVIETSNSILSNVHMLQIQNWSQGIKAYSNSVLSISSSVFEHIGNSDIIYGGAIQLLNSNTTINGSNFNHCTAKQGGWIALLCDKEVVCSHNIKNSYFNENRATIKGGAIYFDLYRPILDKNVFDNNQAVYGNDIASYPVKVRLKDTDSNQFILYNAVSGQVYSPALEFQLIDHYNQVILTDSYSKIRISSISNDALLEGTLTSIVNQGTSSFENLILIAKPGSNNVKYEIISSAIDQDIIDLQYKENFIQEMIDVSFRYCESGEIETNNRWKIWSPDTYSLGANKTECNAWISNAVWLGEVNRSLLTTDISDNFTNQTQ